ncbi:MAG: GNAT family N-acetyltransferase [Oscillospiraceae bacterium]|nr:GNAT family N-acetyltransferase [Oscillospiraceae bacterium]
MISPKKTQILPIKTQRLYITEFTESMAESVHLNSLDEDNRRFIPDEAFETVEDARETIITLMSFYGQYDKPLVYPVFLHDGRQIGHVQVFPVEDGWEVGYHIAKLHTGNGYATEAVNAFLPAVMERLRITQINGICHAENIASRAVLEKCGFSLVYEGVGVLHKKEQPICRYEKSLSEKAADGLIHNIDIVHTTQMGEERIKHNLNLQTDDVVSWCKDAVMQADISIRRGKNWYVYRSGVVLTINAHSFTVITAHKLNAKIRAMQESDYICLREFLYQAIYIPDGVEPPTRSIINAPEIFIYIKDFGTQPGDLGVVAEQNGQIVGAAWTRIIPSYGHIDKNTPELAISIFPGFRSYGIGSRLMKKLFEALRKNGYKQTSLSVQKNNPAVRFYQRLGYRMSGERLDHAGHEDYLMIKEL